MGILTDPSLTHRNKISRGLVKHSRKICFFLYAAGLIWFCCLGHTNFNYATYLSENALSPGLVYSEMKQDTARLAQSLLSELITERENFISRIPHAWIEKKMEEIGLETYVHNFTLNYPLGGGKVFHGMNVYGILRAPRGGSTDGLVFSAPYRPAFSIHNDIVASVPLLLAFADSARKKNYWARDLIFLVTEHEQLGTQAWLEAYYKGGVEYSPILNSGNLPARAGALQAAINLEIQDFDAGHINVKLEGLNGQLPNLDLFNLVQRIAAREHILSGYKQSSRKKQRATQSSIQENLHRMISMIMSQATGIPTGNHGLFHRYRIESVTLEAVAQSPGNANNRNMATMTLLKTVEGISRSLNNLLERFHQSYFFYILVQNDRFVSIGDFMPCLALMAAAVLIKGFFIWLSMDEESEAPDNMRNSEPLNELPFDRVLYIVLGAASFGLICSILPSNQYIGDFFAKQGLSTEITITTILTLINALAVIAPFFVNYNHTEIELLHVGALNLLGTTLIVIGLLNFSLGFIIAIVAVPLAIIFNTKNGSTMHNLTTAYTFLLNPLLFIYLVVFILTLGVFPEVTVSEVGWKAIDATMKAITFGLVDSMIYGNWLYTIVTGVLFPLWILFWTLCITKSRMLTTKAKLKIK